MASGDPVRLLFLTNIPAPYKTPRLNALSDHDDIDLRVIYANQATHRHDYSDLPEREFSFEHNSSIRLPFFGGELMLDTWSVWRFLTAEADAFVVGGWNYMAVWSALVASRIRDIPIAVVSENTKQRTGVSEGLIRRLIGSFDALFGTSEKASTHLVRLGADSSRVRTIPYCIDVDAFQRNLDPEQQRELAERHGVDDRDVVLYVGLLEERKGVADLLRAARGLDTDSVHLLIVGDGPEYEDLVRQAETLDLPVTFTGNVPNQQLPNYYGLADVFVLPTREDPWGLVLNEALACGTPVVTTTAAGAAGELVVDGENGIVVSPSDPDRLRRGIDRLLDDESLRRRFGENGREVSTAYTPERYAAVVASTMRDLV